MTKDMVRHVQSLICFHLGIRAWTLLNQRISDFFLSTSGIW